jgi:hypothetical protein
MDEYYNLLQKFKMLKDSGFCTALAYCLITGESPATVNKKIGRKRGGAMQGIKLNNALMNAGYVLIEVDVKGYVENLPKKGLDSGTYLVYSSGHVSVIKDGLVLDWTATPESRSKRARLCFQVVKTGEL